MRARGHSFRHLLAAALVTVGWATCALSAKADDQPKPEGTQSQSRRGGPEGRDLPAELAQRLEKWRALHREAESDLRKLLELKPDEAEQAKQLFSALKDLAAKIEELHLPPPLVAREGRQLERLASALQAAKAKAQQFGSPEAAAWLEDASQKIRQQAEVARRAGRGPGGEGRQGRDEADARLLHLRAAIEHLHAAGMNQQAEALEREFGRGFPDSLDQRAPGGLPGFAGYGGLEQDVRQLRGEVQSLQRQLNEMREALQRLTGHEMQSEHKVAQ
jgi:hypothetical protein